MTPTLPIEPAVLFGGLLISLYTGFVACEFARGSGLLTKRWATIRGRWPGSLAIGTGLWATQWMVELAHGAAASVALHWPMAMLSWACAVASAGALLYAAGCLRGSRVRAFAALLLCVGLLMLSNVCGELARSGHDTLAWEYVAWTLGASLCISTAMLLMLGAKPSAAARRISAGQIATLLLLAAVIVGEMLIGPEHPGAGRVGSGGTELPSVVIGVLVGIAAMLVLTFTRMTLRIERHLEGRAQKLSDSLRTANQDVQRLAYRDPLTGLANRLHFDQRLAAAVAKADAERGRLTLLFIDLDGFKPINDCYGHASGDRVLHAVGERLRQVAPKGTTSARIGGDEFVLLLRTPLNTGEASMLASRVLVALRAPFSLGDTELVLSCSIGIVAYPDCGGADKIMACGDAAMYAAKRAGGSTFAFHDPGVGDDVQTQTELMRDLRRAMGSKQFELYYQPKVEARSGRVMGVEALLRWNHPTRGLIGPDLFIPLSERIGLIGSLGDWVLEQACRQVREWQDQGLKMRVAINLSAHQLRRPGLVERIEEQLQRHRIDPGLLTCEVTESTAMSDTRQAQRTLARLGRIGVKISIDDFGTGYSSLSYLRQLPATELKIDRSFVADVATSNDARAIVEAVIKLAHALELSVVAEGVETAAQRELLYKLGCDAFQGYLFAKPLPAEMVLRWALTERPKSRTFKPSLFIQSLFAPLN